jgi:hypothetical protein
MDDFKEWLAQEELNEALSKKWAAIPLALATMMPMKSANQGASPTRVRAAVVQENEKSLDQLAKLINNNYGTKLTSADFKMYKLSDLLKPIYGEKYQDIVKKASLAQQPQKIPFGAGAEDFVELPDDSLASINVKKLDKMVPVIFADLTNFGKDKSVEGFCQVASIGGEEQPFCVVKSPEDLQTLRHELSHAMQASQKKQDYRSDKSLGGEGLFGSYFMNQRELGVRLAEMKRNYYTLTGKIVTSEPESFKQALDHLIKNTDKYSPDVQQLVKIIKQSKKEGLQQKLIRFMKDNIDKVVVQEKPSFIA